MIYKAEYTEQPYSGEYRERVYDVQDCWKSNNWCWLKFYEEDDIWCGTFRGVYKGSAVSDKFGITVVITSDCIYILDSLNGDLIEYSLETYSDIIITAKGDIILTDGYDIFIFTDKKISGIEYIDIPFATDGLQFKGIDDNILTICGYIDYGYDNIKEFYLDCETFEIYM